MSLHAATSPRAHEPISPTDTWRSKASGSSNRKASVAPATTYAARLAGEASAPSRITPPQGVAVDELHHSFQYDLHHVPAAIDDEAQSFVSRTGLAGQELASHPGVSRVQLSVLLEVA